VELLGISGSLRRDSYNTLLLRTAGELLPDGVRLTVWDGLKAVPPYDEDDDVEQAPPAVAALRAAVAGADALLLTTPEYNSSLPGQLKNALDWLSRPLATNPARNKPVAVAGASTGVFGGVWAQAELRKVLAALGARVLQADLPVGSAAERFDAAGLVDERLREQLAAHLTALVALVEEARAAAATAVAA